MNEANNGWLPIASAPKDGTTLLGWVVAKPEPEIGSPGFEAPSLIRWDPGFRNSSFGRAPGWTKQWRGEVTYWMLIPPPPAAKGEAS